MSDASPAGLCARLDELARLLVIRAARNAPQQLATRLEEEWLADLNGRAGPVARLRHALGCCWATRVINQELCPLGVPAAADPQAPSALPAAVETGLAFFSRRTAAILAILGVHLAVLYALASGLVHHLDRTTPTSSFAQVLPDPRVTPALPRVAPPRLWIPPVEVTAPPLIPELPSDPTAVVLDDTGAELLPGGNSAPRNDPLPHKRVGGPGAWLSTER